MTSDSSKNIAWINYVRVICMFCVYLFHTENRAQHAFLGRFFDLSFEPFFVISGYLLYKKIKSQIEFFNHNGGWFKNCGWKYLKNIFYKMVIPSILFATIFFFPKIFIRHQVFDLKTFLLETVGGGSMWFVAALAVGQLSLFFLLVKNKIGVCSWLIFGSVNFVFATMLSQMGFDNEPWYYQGGLCSVLFLAFGALFYEIEQKSFFKSINKTWLWISLAGVYLILAYSCKLPINLTFMQISILGLFASFWGTMVLIQLCKRFRSLIFVDRIGRSTIGLYFLSGAVPETVAVLVRHFMKIDDVAVILITLISFFLAIVINEILLKYFKFVFDIRTLKIIQKF